MTDYLKEYKKEKRLSNISIIAISLIMALGVNFFLLDSTDMGKNLKASILDINNVGDKADFYLEDSGNEIILKSSKQMQFPTTLSLSISYNPDIVEINSINTSLGELTIIGEQNSGNETIIINMDGTKDIMPNNIIIEINAQKKENTSTQINMVNANFIDKENNQYNLTTSGITF